MAGRSVGVVVGAGITLAVCATSTRAAAEPRAWRAEVALADGCRDVFAAEVRARANVTIDAAATRRFVVRVEHRGDVFAGELIVDDGEATTLRAIAGPSCAEVVTGLALVAALAADPRAIDREETGAPGPRMAPSTAPLPPSARSRPTVDGADEPPTAVARAPRWSAGGQLEVGSAAVDPLVAVGVFVAVDASPKGVVAPWARLGGSLTLPTDAASVSGNAALFWARAVPEVSLLRFPLASVVAIRPSAGVELGVVRARGTGGSAVETTSRTRPWVAPRVSAALVLEPARWFGVEIAGGALVPITREAFVFEPAEQVYRPPSVAAFASVSAGLHFP